MNKPTGFQRRNFNFATTLLRADGTPSLRKFFRDEAEAHTWGRAHDIFNDGFIVTPVEAL